MTFDTQKYDETQKLDAKSGQIVGLDKRKVLMQPAPIYTNKFYTAFQKDGMIRIIFADEEVDNNGNIVNEVVRNSVIMTIQAFLILAQTFTNNAQQIMLQQVTRGVKQVDESGENGEKIP